MSTRPRITVVGSANIDLVARCERLPRPGETLTDAVFERIPGGKGANQAVAAARLGAEVRFVGRVVGFVGWLVGFVGLVIEFIRFDVQGVLSPPILMAGA